MIQRIISREERERKRMKNIRMATIVIGIILLLSTLSYAFMSFQDQDSSSSTRGTIEINGVEFTHTGYSWGFNYGGKDFETVYNPQEISNISGEVTLTISDYLNKPLYFGIDTESYSSMGNEEISKNLYGVVLKMQNSCLNEKCELDYPIKNCSNNVIIFKELAENLTSYIEQKDNCVFINFAQGEEQRTADAFLFGVLGIN